MKLEHLSIFFGFKNYFACYSVVLNAVNTEIKK